MPDGAITTQPTPSTTSDIVHTVARIALFNCFTDNEITDLLKAFNIGRLRTQMVGLGICDADADDHDVARLYFSGRCRIISPNSFFDEAWYCGQYPAVDSAVKSGKMISGFVHFMKHGIHQGLWPNGILYADALACVIPGVPREDVDRSVYLNRYPGAAAFVAAFPSIAPASHYNLYGRFLGYSLDTVSVRTSEALSLRVAEAEFDAAFYARRYLTNADDQRFHDNPFEHYVKFGMKAAYSPNSWFQEDWYRAFYKEVRDAIASGMLPSGFYHYMLSGRVEGRMPQHDLALALEARMPGVTAPSLLSRAEMLRSRLAGLKVLPNCLDRLDTAGTIWIFLPTLNPDIMYGGYRAAVELICALHREGRSVAIVCVEEEPNPPYFLWSEQSLRVRKVFEELAILNMAQFTAGKVSRSDLFLAYTVWDLVICNQLCELTGVGKPILLAQEYEPIFYDNGAQRALCESCYKIAHYPIFNSNFLLSYFLKNKLGPFAGNELPLASRDFAVFEHKTNKLPTQDARSMRERRDRVLAVYARPEAHAARNLFEVVIIALQTLCARGAFGPEWRFIGLGALTKMPPVPLGGGHELRLTQKLSEQDYKIVMSELDIGISLMYAPHPSVVPFEFATTGALVVTNTYDNRSAEELREVCGNIVPCELSIDSVVCAIEQAVEQLDNYDQRVSRALKPKALSWEEIFSTSFIGEVLSAVESQKRPSVSRDRNGMSPRQLLHPAIHPAHRRTRVSRRQEPQAAIEYGT